MKWNAQTGQFERSFIKMVKFFNKKEVMSW